MAANVIMTRHELLSLNVHRMSPWTAAAAAAATSAQLYTAFSSSLATASGSW
jgi:hypothetical protein